MCVGVQVYPVLTTCSQSLSGDIQQKMDQSSVQVRRFGRGREGGWANHTYLVCPSPLPDMAIQNVIGDSFRGATWVSIHNGGGVGW